MHAQDPDAGRRQLQGQRDAVEPLAQRRDGLGVTLVEAETRRRLTDARDEQLYGAEMRQGGGLRVGCRAGQVQRGYCPGDFTRQHQRLPAGRQDAQLRSGLQQPGSQLGGLADQVFAVVQEQKHPAGAQRIGYKLGRVHRAVVPDTQDGHDQVCGCARPGLRGPGQFDQPDTVGEGISRLGGRLQGQPRLTHPAWPGERHQPALIQQRPQFGHRRRPANHAGEHGGKVGPGRRRQGGRGRHALKTRSLFENRLIEGGQAGPGIQAKVVS